MSFLLLNDEGAIYSESKAQEGGWNGTREFVVSAKTPESALVIRFILTPADVGAVHEQQVPALSSYHWYARSTDAATTDMNGSTGLMELAPISADLPLTDGNFYLCGPSGFMRVVKDQLLALNVATEHIHYEVFGPHAELYPGRERLPRGRASHLIRFFYR